MQDCYDFPLYVFSDLDGTLGIEGEGIPEQNRLALKKFVSMGGRFGICTGRSPESARQFLGDIPINLPSVVNGGCALYDFTKNEAWDEFFLPAGALDFAKRVILQFPQASLLVVNRDGYFQIYPDYQKGKYPLCEKDRLKPLWYRLIVVSEPDKLPAIAKYMELNAPKGLRIERTAPDFAEIMPAQAGKFEAMQRLCAQTGIFMDEVAFLGDFYNDIDLLKHVGLSACVGDAPKEVQSVCSVILSPCMDGAVVPLLQLLERDLDKKPAPSYIPKYNFV